MKFLCCSVLVLGLVLVAEIAPVNAEPMACLTMFSTVKIRENNCRRFERPFNLAELVEVVEQSECPCFDLNTLRTIPREEERERLGSDLELAALEPAPEESELFCLDTSEGTAIGRMSPDVEKAQAAIRVARTSVLAAAGRESFGDEGPLEREALVAGGNGEAYLCLLDEDMTLPRDRQGEILADEAMRCRDLLRSYAALLGVECTDALPEPDPKDQF